MGQHNMHMVLLQHCWQCLAFHSGLRVSFMQNQLPAHLVMLDAPLHPEGLEPHTRLEDEPLDGAVLQLQ
jgi:hypothetical protein